MDLSRFETLARALAHGESRRRLLGALSGTALGGLLAAGLRAETDAKKHHGKKKKKKCRGCAQCQACRKGKCQEKPEGSTCSSGACQAGGLCSCTVDPITEENNCPTGCGCETSRGSEALVCVQSEDIFAEPQCPNDTECGPGKACIHSIDPTSADPVDRCVAVCRG